MRRTRYLRFLLPLGALALALSGCGAEAIPSEEGASAPTTARIETVNRSSGTGGTHEVRMTSVVDYVRDRSSYVEPTTGCTSITIGNVSYNEVPPGMGLPEGKRWVKYSWEAHDSEAEFEATQKPQQDADGWTGYAPIGFIFPDPPPGEYLEFPARKLPRLRAGRPGERARRADDALPRDA